MNRADAIRPDYIVMMVTGSAVLEGTQRTVVQACACTKCMQQKIARTPFVRTWYTYTDFRALLDPQGNFDKAATLLNQSLVIRERALGAHHPAVATTITELALLVVLQVNVGDVELPHNWLILTPASCCTALRTPGD